MAPKQPIRTGTFVIAATACGWVIGALPVMGAVIIRPSADGTLRDEGVNGVLQGEADVADWFFNESSFEGAITLNTTTSTWEDRVVWEYNLSSVGQAPPVYATLNFTLRGAPARPRPDVDVHVYAYDADLAETLADFSTGYSGGPPLLLGSITVPPYQPSTTYSINVSPILNAALGVGGNMAVAFRFQIDPRTPFALNQAFIDALETEPESKPFLEITSAPQGDLTGDGEVNLADFAWFSACMSGPASEVSEGCLPADLNADSLVDMGDLRALQLFFSNP